MLWFVADGVVFVWGLVLTFDFSGYMYVFTCLCLLGYCFDLLC